MMLGTKRSLTYCFVLILLAFLVPNNVHASITYIDYFPGSLEGDCNSSCFIAYNTLIPLSEQGLADIGVYINFDDDTSTWDYMYAVIYTDLSCTVPYSGATNSGYVYNFDNSSFVMQWQINTPANIKCIQFFKSISGVDTAFNSVTGDSLWIIFEGDGGVIDIVDQPSQVFFNGFILFLAFASWIIWIFRPKSN